MVMKLIVMVGKSYWLALLARSVWAQKGVFARSILLLFQHNLKIQTGVNVVFFSKFISFFKFKTYQTVLSGGGDLPTGFDDAGQRWMYMPSMRSIVVVGGAG